MSGKAQPPRFLSFTDFPSGGKVLSDTFPFKRCHPVGT